MVRCARNALGANAPLRAALGATEEGGALGREGEAGQEGRGREVDEARERDQVRVDEGHHLVAVGKEPLDVRAHQVDLVLERGLDGRREVAHGLTPGTAAHAQRKAASSGARFARKAPARHRRGIGGGTAVRGAGAHRALRRASPWITSKAHTCTTSSAAA